MLVLFASYEDLSQVVQWSKKLHSFFINWAALFLISTEEHITKGFHTPQKTARANLLSPASMLPVRHLGGLPRTYLRFIEQQSLVEASRTDALLVQLSQSYYLCSYLLVIFWVTARGYQPCTRNGQALETCRKSWGFRKRNLGGYHSCYVVCCSAKCCCPVAGVAKWSVCSEAAAVHTVYYQTLKLRCVWELQVWKIAAVALACFPLCFCRTYIL